MDSDSSAARTLAHEYTHFVKEWSPESEEGKLVMQMQDSYQQLSDLFAEALNRASENYRETGYGDVAGENAEEADIQRGGRAKKEKDPYAKYYGMTDEEFKAAWLRTYSWDELTAKAPVSGVLLSAADQVPMNQNGTVNIPLLEKEVKDKLESVSDKGITTYYAKANDIGESVEISDQGITHGLQNAKSVNGVVPSQTQLLNARAVLSLPEILAGAKEVNIKTNRSNPSIPFARVLLGFFGDVDSQGTTHYYGVRIVIDQHADRSTFLKSYDIIGSLYAVNAKEIAPTSSSALTVSGSTVPHSGAIEVSVADLLSAVKDNFPDTFAEDVYNYNNWTSRHATRGGDFTVGLLYSTRSTGLDSRTILEGYEPQNDLESRMVGKYLTALEQLRSMVGNVACPFRNVR